MEFDFIRFLKQLPFGRLIFPFVAGIVTAINLDFVFDLHLFFILFGILVTVFIFSVFFVSKRNLFRLRYLPGIFANILIFTGGIFLTEVNKAEKFNSYGKDIIYEATVSEPVIEKENSYKTILKNVRYKYNDSVFFQKSGIIAYFPKSEEVKKLKYGDKIIFKAVVNEVKNPGNPHEFDYKKYLFGKGITGRVFIQHGNWHKVSSGNGSFIFDRAYKIRNKLEKIYENYGIKGSELAVLQALTLGDRSEIDDEIRRSYVAAGAMHILAVSGLHVGIIFMLFNFLLKFLDKVKYKEFYAGKLIKSVILILVIWSFAVLSGLSPSIRRAAVMFTVIIIAKALNRKVNIYNSVSASAFVLLLINPFQITEVGFQLSYAAVIGIIFYQPKIRDLITVKNKFLYYIWSLTAVSVAAQIGTAPVTLYYFHIFPVFFFLSNIVVIPGATLVLILAFALLLSSPLPFIPEIIARILNFLIYILNSSVSFIEKMPYSTAENIPFHIEDLILAFLFLISFTVFVVLKKGKALQLSLLFVLIWITAGTFRKYKKLSYSDLTVYNINKYTVADITGGKNYFVFDKKIADKKIIEYNIIPNRRYFNRGDFNTIKTDTSLITDFFIFKNGVLITETKVFIFLKDNLEYISRLKPKLKADYLIISGDCDYSFEEIMKYVDFESVVIDSSNGYYKAERRKTECEKYGIKYYSVKDEGAFTCKI